MIAEVFQLRGLPAPLLEHLTRHFAKVYCDALWTVEAGELDFRYKVVDAVAELVEGRDDIKVPQQAGLVRCGLGEGTYEGGHRVVPCPILLRIALGRRIQLKMTSHGRRGRLTGWRQKEDA